MAYQPWAALRKVGTWNAGRRMAGPAAALFALALGACAQDPDWPAVGRITDLSGAMTPEERQQALKDMQQKGGQTRSGSISQSKQTQ
jgi:hypothetical protein